MFLPKTAEGVGLGVASFRNSMGLKGNKTENKEEKGKKNRHNTMEVKEKEVKSTPPKTKKPTPKPPKKSRRFNMVMTEDEYIRVLQNAQNNKTVTDYILESCLSDKKRPYKMTPEVIAGLVQMNKQLSAIGNNVNQTTKHIHFLMQHNLINEGAFKRHQTDLMKYTTALIKLEATLSKFMKG